MAPKLNVGADGAVVGGAAGEALAPPKLNENCLAAAGDEEPEGARAPPKGN